MPTCKVFDVILIVIVQFTKMAHFLPSNKGIRSKETLDLVPYGIIIEHGP